MAMKPLSLLDTDLYKLTMGQAVLKKFPYARAKYRFVNRNLNQHITPDMVKTIQERVVEYSEARLTDEESHFLRSKCPYLQPWYVDWLEQFEINPLQVRLKSCDVKAGDTPTQMELTVEGPWCETIYWEVPLLAIITATIMGQQVPSTRSRGVDIAQVRSVAGAKATQLSENNCRFAEFGTRRRYSYAVQDNVIGAMRCPAMMGTSNVHLAMKHGIMPIGTMAHEWIQAISGLVGLRHANKFALEAWNDVYQGWLGIALTDTFTSRAFFKDFNGSMARMFDGVRHDSGDPFALARHAIDHYKRLKIDPTSKTIIFSDSLDVAKCADIAHEMAGKIKVAFGIGTHLTNDVPGTQPANVVIKLIEIDGVPVVKLSDDPTKAIGDPKAIDVAKWTFGVS